METYCTSVGGDADDLERAGGGDESERLRGGRVQVSSFQLQPRESVAYVDERRLERKGTALERLSTKREDRLFDDGDFFQTR